MEKEIIESISDLKEMFKKILTINNWTIKLIKIKNTKKRFDVYEISDFNGSGIKKFVDEILENYINLNLNNYQGIEDYRKKFDENSIVKFNENDSLISEVYEKLKKELDNVDKNFKLDDKYNAYVFESSIKFNEMDIPIILIFMYNPILILQNRGMAIFNPENKFSELKGNLLTFKNVMDGIVIGQNIIVFNKNMERLLDLERTERIESKKIIEEIIHNGAFTNDFKFEEIAQKGQNYRKILSFSIDRFKAILKDSVKKELIAKEFKINIVNNKFDTDDEISCENLLKFICNKGMLDPVTDEAVEVSSSKKWGE